MVAPISNFCELSQKKCKPCEGGVSPMNLQQVLTMLKNIPGWDVDKTGEKFIFRIFKFPDFFQTMAFVNAIAWIAHSNNHHPDLDINYNQCKILYQTHAINGLSENDFICAAKINTLIEGK